MYSPRLTHGHIGFTGVEDDDTPAEESGAASTGTEDMPPLEGDEDDASRMEEVD